MSGTESFIGALSAAGKAARAAEAAAGRSMSSAEAGMRAARDAAAAARKEAAELRGRFAWTERVPGGNLVARLAWRLSPSSDPRRRELRACEAEARASKLLATWKKSRVRKASAAGLASRIETAETGARHLGELPWDLAPAAARATGAAESAIRRGGRGLVDSSEALCSVAETWIARKAAAPGARTPKAEQDHPAALETIWLPIPKSAGPFAKAAGAVSAKGQGRGSVWHVPVGTDLAPLERFLPLAYRRSAPALAFPPVPYAAAGQNLWGVFDRVTWDQIRTMNYERTGYRCMLCGGRGGKLSKAIGGGAGGVECHEVWDWRIPDPDVSVGVQRLKGLLVCCPDCHLMFHESHARARARPLGLEDAARKHLMQRRAFITRTHPVDVAAGMRAESERLKAMSGTAIWIMDLARLGGQDYMSHLAPVMVEDNPARVRPGQVAGLAFTTDGGAAYPAVPARRIYASIADLYRHDPRMSAPAA